jgi:paraquat-inducible protein A
VAGPLERGRAAPGARAMFRLHEHFTDWGMLEVYLLGLLISVVKLREIVEIETGAGLLCFGGTVLLVVLLSVWLDPEDVWRRLKSAKPLG